MNDPIHLSAMMHARRRGVGRKLGTFGTQGGNPEGMPYRSMTAAEVLPGSEGVQNADRIAEEHRRDA